MLEPKLEIFAQALAMGKSQSDAYRGMVPKTKAADKSIHTLAGRIAEKVDVRLRLKELQAEAKENFKISVGQKKAWLKQVIERSLQVEEVTNRDGEAIGQFKFQGGDAIRAIHELNKMDGDHSAEKRQITGADGSDLIPSGITVTFVGMDE
ncbi:MAG: hypothetical protein HOF98_02565 [Gammaproteobacteria bacterium]|nr:hypothetical protein [Gammaproteobacteria bacterium]MBT6418894.1 hypothetical protein [Gammaproteobacteria bacterium]